MTKRILGSDEKKQIAEERRMKEISTHPDKMISVLVEDETDDQGAPVVTVHYVGERSSSKKPDDT